MATKPKKPPKYLRYEFDVDPGLAFAPLMGNVKPPAGYVFKEMTRKGSKAKVVLQRIEG